MSPPIRIGCGKRAASTNEPCRRINCNGEHPGVAMVPAKRGRASEAATTKARDAALRERALEPENTISGLEPYRDQIETEVGELAHAFARDGHAFHLVGGRVRDAMLGLPLDNDIDITTDARPEQIKPILEGWAGNIRDQGARFGTIAATRDSIDVEVTTFRSETYVSDSRKPDVQFSDDVHTDLSRRDFTINAMALSMPSWELLDPFGGANDLERRILRTPSEPDGLFCDDPLRMLRAARFVARFNLSADPEMTEAIRRNKERISIVSSERIGSEINKLLSLPRCHRGLEYLLETGALNAVLDSRGYPPVIGVSSDFDAAVGPDPDVRWAALFGKDLGADKTASLMRDLATERGFASNARHILNAVDAVKALPDCPTDTQIRRLVGEQREHNWRHALDLMWAWGQWPGSDVVRRIVATSEREGLELRILAVEGHQLSQIVGGPGPRVGEALRFLRDHQYEHGPLNKSEAVALIEAHFGG